LPVEMFKDAETKHNYTNPTISTALEDSYSSIMQILTGNQLHCVMTEFQVHIAAFNGWHELSKQMHIADFSSCFPIPILPSNKSLIDLFCCSTKVDMKQNGTPISYDILMGPL